MKVKSLIEHLRMLPNDMEVYLQTVPEDYATPLNRERMKIWPASHCEKYGLQPAKLVLTVMPEEKS